MTMDICYRDPSGLQVSILNATSGNLNYFTSAVTELLRHAVEDANSQVERAVRRARQNDDVEYDQGDPDDANFVLELASYQRFLDEQVEEARRSYDEDVAALAAWRTFWDEDPTVTVSGMLLTITDVQHGLEAGTRGYASQLVREGIRVLRDHGDLPLFIA